jgi:hypothetical protein
LSLLGVVIIPIALIGFAVLGYQLFRDISTTPDRLPDPGEVRLVFDRPGVPALLEATITSTEFEATAFDYFIRIKDGFEADEVDFTIVTISAIRSIGQPMFPRGPPSQPNGCPVTVYVVPEKGSTCASVRIGDEGFPGSRYLVGAQLITGRIQRNESGAMFATVHARAQVPVSTSAGKRANFRLPAIGTTYLPADGRDLALDFGTDRDLFVPGELDVIVQYDELEPTDRLQSVAPDPFRAGKLAWVEADASMIAAHGSVVDITAEERGQRLLFMLGVLAGVITGMVSNAVLLLLRAVFRLWRRR